MCKWRWGLFCDLWCFARWQGCYFHSHILNFPCHARQQSTLKKRHALLSGHCRVFWYSVSSGLAKWPSIQLQMYMFLFWKRRKKDRNVTQCGRIMQETLRQGNFTLNQHLFIEQNAKRKKSLNFEPVQLSTLTNPYFRKTGFWGVPMQKARLKYSRFRYLQIVHFISMINSNCR